MSPSTDAPSATPEALGNDLVSIGSGYPTGEAGKDAVIKAYVAYLTVTAKGYAVPDPQYAGVEQVATQGALSGYRRIAADLRTSGQREIGSITINPKVVGVGDRFAALTDCVDTSKAPVVDSAGAVVPASRTKVPVTVNLAAATAGSWQVSSYASTEGTC